MRSGLRLLDPGAARLDKYELVRPLARGGMAELYLARQRGLEGFEKLVVLKRMLPTVAATPECVTMFLGEARVAALLHHPNVLEVYDVGRDDDEYFIAMEFLDGVDLRTLGRCARARGVRVGLEHVLHVATRVCEALAYVHDATDEEGGALGIVHRDVSPHNIVITFDGHVKLVDFGIAKVEARASSRTLTGVIKGKLSYMSPEQSQGLPLDGRSDVFSLGIVLWELCTGARLFASASEYHVLRSLNETDAPSPSTLVPTCPPELAAIVARALQRDVSLRYQSAAEMQVDLERCVATLGLASSPRALAATVRELTGRAAAPSLDGTASGRTVVELIAECSDEIEAEAPLPPAGPSLLRLEPPAHWDDRALASDAPTVRARPSVLPGAARRRRWWRPAAVLAATVAAVALCWPTRPAPARHDAAAERAPLVLPAMTATHAEARAEVAAAMLALPSLHLEPPTIRVEPTAPPRRKPRPRPHPTQRPAPLDLDAPLPP